MKINLVFDYSELIMEKMNEINLTISYDAIAEARYDFGWDLILMDIGALISYEGLIVPISSNDRDSINQAQQCIEKYKSTRRICDVCMDEDQNLFTMCANINCDKVMCAKCVNKILKDNIKSKCPFCRRVFFSCRRAEIDQARFYGLRLNEIADTFGGGTTVALHISFDEDDVQDVILLRIGDKYDAWIGPFLSTCEQLVHTRANIRVCGTLGSSMNI